MSRWLILLSYEGRRSGRRYTTPVLYWWTDTGRDNTNTAVLLTLPQETNWWRNFRGGHTLMVRFRNAWRNGWGEVITDEATVLAHLRHVAAPFQRASRILPTRPLPSDEHVARAAATVVLVRVTFTEGEAG